jgi:glycosyltransferase involved in cell wall biosynthesis
MNILIYAPQMAAFGGMERHVCGLAGLLGTHGHRVTLLTTSNSLAAGFRDELARAGVTLRELARRRGTASRMHKSLWLLREAMRLAATRWDLIYTNGQSALARFVWIAARSQTRIVHHHHTAADAREQATWSASFRRVLQQAPELVACSRATRQAIAQAIGRDDVTFLPYLTRCSVDRARVRDRRYAPDALLHFGFMGRLVAEKGIDALCQLSEHPQLRDVRWHVHGAGADYPPAFFERFPNVIYHGPYTAGTEQAEIMEALDALALFSCHNEGMPLSLIEALSAGLPWIATDQGGTRELAASPENCLVVPTPFTPETLAAAVREMADRLRRGLTSRVAQRRVYDRLYAPAVVSEAWCAFFGAHHLELQSA